MSGVIELIKSAYAEPEAPCDSCPQRARCAKGYACADFVRYIGTTEKIRWGRPRARWPSREIYLRVFECGE